MDGQKEMALLQSRMKRLASQTLQDEAKRAGAERSALEEDAITAAAG